MIAAITLLGAAAIAGSGWLYAMSHLDRAAAEGTFSEAVPHLRLSTTPPDGAAEVRPDALVTAMAQYGVITGAELTPDDGAPAAGTLAPDGSGWSSAGATLAPASRYHVTLALDTPRGPVRRRWSFSTLKPTRVLTAELSPGDGDIVGVGQPVVLHFGSAVKDRAAVERRLHVLATPPVVGSWHWFGDREVHYRPNVYWPAGTKVAVAAALTGVDGGGGVWGERDHTASFAVGDAHVSVVDVQQHTMTVTSNSRTVNVYPQSAGSPKYPTMGGVHVVLERQADVIMDSATNGIPRDSPDGYYEHVYWDVRISNGGEFVHAAPWSLSAQGSDNVSHGCVNLSPQNATEFFAFSRRGDIVRVVGSSRPPEPDAGTNDWNMSWAQWLAGSALAPAPTPGG
jgi:lipoprotein-anchoring transpeptidase ErfK/SrfK